MLLTAAFQELRSSASKAEDQVRINWPVDDNNDFDRQTGASRNIDSGANPYLLAQLADADRSRVGHWRRDDDAN